MKYSIVSIILAASCLSACAEHHSYQLNGESLTILYENKDANEVIFACSLDRYLYHPALKTKKNLWAVSVPAAGEFSYFYMVDGAVTLPERCHFTEQDDFGSQNCLYVQGM